MSCMRGATVAALTGGNWNAVANRGFCGQGVLCGAGVAARWVAVWCIAPLVGAGDGYRCAQPILRGLEASAAACLARAARLGEPAATLFTRALALEGRASGLFASARKPKDLGVEAFCSVVQVRLVRRRPFLPGRRDKKSGRRVFLAWRPGTGAPTLELFCRQSGPDASAPGLFWRRTALSSLPSEFKGPPMGRWTSQGRTRVAAFDVRVVPCTLVGGLYVQTRSAWRFHQGCLRRHVLRSVPQSAFYAPTTPNENCRA